MGRYVGNGKKCKIMHVGLKNPKYSYELLHEGCEIVRDRRRTGNRCYSPQQSETSQAVPSGIACTAGAVLRTLGRNFHYQDRNVCMKLYKQYVRPIVGHTTEVKSVKSIKYFVNN